MQDISRDKIRSSAEEKVNNKRGMQARGQLIGSAVVRAILI